jgi:UDP-N-acetylglucosamine 1-carboxyvinyltransferase
MDKIIVKGGQPLFGEVSISGAKNAVLPIMTACILAPGKYILNNVPDLRDTRTMAKLLTIIGATVEYNNNTMVIDTTECNNPKAPYDLVKTMRASFYVLGPFLGRFGFAEVSLPGGCAWGPRPVDLHLKAIEALGADVSLESGSIVAKADSGLTGATIAFDISSVGATGNALMAAVKASGKTIIKNAAKEPEITSLAEFLIKMGAIIDGLGTDELIVTGVNELKGDFEFDIIADRIEAGTFMIATALCGGEITLKKAKSNHLDIVISKLKEAGAIVTSNDVSITVKSGGNINPVNITTAPYPGYPTDLQAQWMALMAKAKGSSIIIEEIYKDRFTHIAELTRLGAIIKLEDNVAVVTGNNKLNGAPVMSTDIRASASLILATLSANGESEISRVYHIDRGYENVEEKFRNLGANIYRVSE